MEPIYEERLTSALLSDINDDVDNGLIDENNSHYYSSYSAGQTRTSAHSLSTTVATTATSSLEDGNNNSNSAYDESFYYLNHNNERTAPPPGNVQNDGNEKDEYCSFASTEASSHATKQQQKRNEKPQRRCCHRFKKCCASIFTIRTFSQLFILFITLLLVASLIGLPTLAFFAAFHGKVKSTSYCIAGFFVLLTLPLSLHEIIMHLTNWYMPSVQKYVVRILFMVPIYSVQSWLSLYFQSATFYIDTVRELYEAFVISSFVYYLVALLGGEETLKTTLRRKDPKHERHPFFLQWIVGTWNMGGVFLMWCKTGVLQYVVVKTIASITTMTLKGAGMYNEGKFGWAEPFTYVAIALNLSMAFAMYCLVKFFYATKEELRAPINWHPIGKFLCIKGIVFFTWWQGFLITILESYGVITNIGSWDSKLVAGGLQDLLICIEMLCFAIAHRYTFTHKEYAPEHVGDAMVPIMAVPVEDDNDENNDIYCRSEDAASQGVRMQNVARQQQQQEQDRIQHQESDEYNPPTIRQLDVPVGVGRAIWSSAIPGEMFKDLRRLSRGANAAAMDLNDDEFVIDMKDAQSV